MSRVNIRVRRAEPADVPALVELALATDLLTVAFGTRAPSGERSQQLSERFDHILAAGERVLLVAVDEPSDALTGLLVAVPDEIGAIDLTPVLHVTHMVVAPSQRRRGIGRALLAAAVHLADELGIERVLASAAAGSREGNRYLARLGFAPLVVHRTASTAVLRRSLGMSGSAQRLTALRRARLIRAQRGTGAVRLARRA